jgi:hypothetical protein
VSILRPPPLPKDSTLVRQIGDPHVHEIFLGAFNRKIGLIKPIHCSRCVLDDVVDDGLSTESFGQDVECGGCGCPQTFASRYLSPVSAISVDRTTKPVLVECGLPRRRHYSRFSGVGTRLGNFSIGPHFHIPSGSPPRQLAATNFVT